MKTNRPEAPEDIPARADSLDSRYGAIGISAVAAAVRYQGETKNPAHKPAEPAGAPAKRKSELAA